jgi:hypothetical protein
MSRVLRDARTWPEWQPEIVRSRGPERLSDGDAVLGDAEMLGFKVAGRADMTSVSDARIEQDVIVGIRMHVTYEVHPHGQGSVVTHRFQAELPRGLSGRVLSFFLRFRLRRMQQKLLANLEGIPSQGLGRPG